jgi:hypothetical protein
MDVLVRRCWLAGEAPLCVILDAAEPSSRDWGIGGFSVVGCGRGIDL